MKFRLKKSAICTGIIATICLMQQPSYSAEKNFAVLQKWSLGSVSKWDYTDIDPVRHRLFVTRGDRVEVFELPSGKLIDQIPNTMGVHGVAFAEDLKLGFTSNGKTNSVTVFDLDTLKVKQEIKVDGVNPDAILYEPNSKKLFVFNGKTANATVIDGVSLKVIASIPTNGRPEFAVSNNAGKIFFNIEDKSQLNAIDVATNKLISSWHLKNCEEPTGLAMDIVNDRLFSVCQNKTMIVTDAKNGKVIAEVTIGEHPDAVIYDQETATIFSSNGDGGGSLTVIKQLDSDHYKVLDNVSTAQGAKTMAMDKKTKVIYLPTVVDKQFVVLSVGNK